MFNFINNNLMIRIRKQKTQHSVDKYYKKRLNTQSFTQSKLLNFETLSSKMEKVIRDAECQSRKSHKNMIEVRKRQINLERKELESRQTIRSKIEQKMRQSQTNLQSIKKSRKIQSLTRGKFQQAKIKNIQKYENDILQQCLKKSQQSQRATLKYLTSKRQKERQQFSRSSREQTSVPLVRFNQFNPQKSQFFNRKKISKKFQSISLDKRYRPISLKKNQKIKVLKINEQELKKKQKIKNQIIQIKDRKNLGEYIMKMEQISKIRVKNMNNFVPRRTLVKVDRTQQKYATPSSYHYRTEQDEIKKTKNKKLSFSQVYSQKLQDRSEIQQFFNNIAMKSNDNLLEKGHKKAILIKQDKLIKQIVNDVKRKMNFKYMTALFRKRL